MPTETGERCVTCRYARNPHTEHSEVVDVKLLTCFRDLPHVCQPWNRCKYWEPKEDMECAK